MSEQVFNSDNWSIEAKAVIEDVRHHVNSAEISKIRTPTDHCIYINIETLEKQLCCVQMSRNGFRIVGRAYDVTESPEGAYFETPYSLLQSLSPSYTVSFGNALKEKLENLLSSEEASSTDK